MNLQCADKALKLQNGKIEISKCPVTSDLHRYRDQMIKILIECGLSPSARQEVSTLGETNDENMRDDSIYDELEHWIPDKDK